MRSYRQGELLEIPPKDGFFDHPKEVLIELCIVPTWREPLYCAFVGSISSIGVVYKCNIWVLY